MPERKVAPPEKLSKLVEDLMNGQEQQTKERSALLSELAQLGAQRLIQEALEKEQADARGL